MESYPKPYALNLPQWLMGSGFSQGSRNSNWGYVGIMEKKMETTITGLGFRVIWDLEDPLKALQGLHSAEG